MIAKTQYGPFDPRCGAAPFRAWLLCQQALTRGEKFKPVGTTVAAIALADAYEGTKYADETLCLLGDIRFLADEREQATAAYESAMHAANPAQSGGAHRAQIVLMWMREHPTWAAARVFKAAQHGEMP